MDFGMDYLVKLFWVCVVGAVVVGAVIGLIVGVLL